MKKELVILTLKIEALKAKKAMLKSDLATTKDLKIPPPSSNLRH